MNPEKLIKYSLPFFVFAIASRAVEEISFIYYAVPVMCLFFIVQLFNSSKFNSTKNQDGDSSTQFTLNNGEGFRMTQPSEDTSTSLSVTDDLNHNNHFTSSIIHFPFSIFILPGLWFLFTSIWSSYPEVSAIRALYFILISLGCISAGILWLRYSEKNIFDFLFPANVIVIVICVFSILTNIPSDSWTGGHGKGFMGFFGHQNLLASVLLFTLPAVISKLQKPVNSNQLSVNSNKSDTKSQPTTNYLLLTSYFLLLASNLILLTLTYSRSALLSLILGGIVFLILNKNWKVLTYSFAIAAILSIIIYLTPTLNQFTDKLIKKDFPEFYSSRMWMWEPSYRAAINGGLTGLGYGISDPDIKPGSLGDHYEGERFIREKGNSVLGLIEETGLIGLVLFLIPMFYVLIKFRVRPFDTSTSLSAGKLRVTNYSLLTAAFTAFILHSQFEAWWVGIGSVQLPLFFIYIGLIFHLSQTRVQ